MFFNDNLKWWQVQAIRKMKITLSEIYVIEQFLTGHPVTGLREVGELEKRGYIKNGELTPIAKEVYNGIVNLEQPLVPNKDIKKEKATIKSEYDRQWNTFWEDWPSRNGFTWNGTKFPGTRSMKSNEEKCKLLYLKIMAAGKYTPEQILHAKRAMFTTKMQESYKKGKNEVQYLNGMEPWLRQEIFRNWVDAEIVEEKQSEESYNWA